VIGFAELMTSEAFGPLGDTRYREFSGHIRKSGAHLLELINDVLDLSKLDAGRLELSEEDVEPLRVVNDAVGMLRMQANEAGIALQIEVDVKLPSLRIDRRRVRQVLVNLVSNAVKFTPQGGKVTVYAFRNATGLTIAVADTGIGIAPNDITKAFESFRQIDSRLSRRYEGAGLGLPLTKQIVERHGGTIALDSRVGEGTIATVTFPAERVIVRQRVIEAIQQRELIAA
jgi:signal transduction histidine kinase